MASNDPRLRARLATSNATPPQSTTPVPADVNLSLPDGLPENNVVEDEKELKLASRNWTFCVVCASNQVGPRQNPVQTRSEA